MPEYRYTRFYDSNGAKAEKEYNRMGRREKYLTEREWKHNIIYFGEESELYPYGYKGCIPETERSDFDIDESDLIGFLYEALRQFQKTDPDDYRLIMDYFFPEKKISMKKLGEQRGISKQTVSRKIKKSLKIIKQSVLKLSQNSQ